MTLFEGTYKLKREMDVDQDWFHWTCTVIFDGLEVKARAKTRRSAFRKGHRAMVRAIRLRSTIRSIKGLCDE